MSARSTPALSPIWEIADVLDFEHFLALDRGRTERDLAARDAALLPAECGISSPRGKVRLWLEARRAEPRTVALPGAIFQDALWSATMLLALGGLVFGALLAVLHLVYYGTKPINVVVFLTVTLLPQWLLLLALIVGARGNFRGLGFIPALLRGLISLREKALAQADGSQRLGWQSLLGTWQTKQALYGRLWPWTLLRLTQVFAIAFNLGVLAMLLLLITVSNRAFGWETTLNIGPDAMFSAVQAFAFPWSWLPAAHPTLAQIVGSRVALQGAGAYPTAALVAWWPFLCYALVVYGLLPRLGLWVAAVVGQRRALAALAFNHADARQILRRMEPLISAGPAGAELETVTTANAAGAVHGDCLLIIARDLETDLPVLEPMLARLGWRPSATLRMEVDAGAPIVLASPPKSVVLALDAARPPIKAILLFIHALRGAVARETEIAVLLIAVEVSAETLAIWRQKMATLHDPFLSVEAGKLR